jgi:hypothetical protein
MLTETNGMGVEVGPAEDDGGVGVGDDGAQS